MHSGIGFSIIFVTDGVYQDGNYTFTINSSSGPHYDLGLQWENHHLCSVRQVVIKDILNRSSAITNPSQPLAIKSTTAFSLTHWMDYTIRFDYSCKQSDDFEVTKQFCGEGGELVCCITCIYAIGQHHIDRNYSLASAANGFPAS